VQKLVTARQLLEEGNTDEDSGRGCLRHCIGDHGYFEESERGNQEHYSLRSPENKPMVTFTIRLPQRDTVQIKGWSNRLGASIDKGWDNTASSRDNYTRNLAARLGRKDIETYLDEEAMMLNEAFRVLKVRPSVDSEPMQERLRAIASRQRQRGGAGDVALQGGGNRRGSTGRPR
jgi:hypothetical protein